MPNVTPPPVPTRERMADAQTGVATRPWVSWFTTLGKLYGYYQTVFSTGTAVPQETVLDFSSDFILTDNPTAGTTEVSLTKPYSVQFGQDTVPPTGTAFASLVINFPTAFTTAPKVFVNPADFPRGGNEPFSCYATNITTAGFTVNLSCSVPTGGGGATILNNIPVDWLAIA